MSTLAEIEAALPSLSAEELARVEAALRRIQRDRGSETVRSEADIRLDGLPWPQKQEEITALLAELDALPALLTPEEADRFEAWRAAEKERQKAKDLESKLPSPATTSTAAGMFTPAPGRPLSEALGSAFAPRCSVSSGTVCSIARRAA